MDDLITVAQCAECGEGGADLKMCNACKHINYCSVTCQRRHWPRHKNECKQRAARLHDKSLFKQPPPKDDCPICFLPMPFACHEMAARFSCCGKIVCKGCDYSCLISRNLKCPFCNADKIQLVEISLEQTKKRVEANDANSIWQLGGYYGMGAFGLQKDRKKANELYTRAAELGSFSAHYQIGWVYEDGLGVEKDVKKAIHHYELAAMAGHELARCRLGVIEYKFGNVERAIKHFMISASAGWSQAMEAIKFLFKKRHVKRDLYELTLQAYNDSCAEMRSKAREDGMSAIEELFKKGLAL